MNTGLMPLTLAAMLPRLSRPLFATLFVLIVGCSSTSKGVECVGQRQNLEGKPMGTVQGRIVDHFNSFSVMLADLTLESGALYSSDHARYIPSAVTRDGWLLQRISDRQFSMINSPQDQMITFSCPAPGQL